MRKDGSATYRYYHLPIQDLLTDFQHAMIVVGTHLAWENLSFKAESNTPMALKSMGSDGYSIDLTGDLWPQKIAIGINTSLLT